MNTPDQALVLQVLREAIELARRLDVTEEVTVLQRFSDRCKNEEPTFELLRGQE